MIFEDEVLNKEYQTIKIINESYEAEGKILQESRIKELIDFASSHVEAYKAYNGKTLKSFPVINKQVILQNKRAYITPLEVLNEIEYYSKTTSGSSGTPFEFQQDSNCRMKLTASLKYWNHSVGFHEGDLILHLRSLRQYYTGSNEKQDFVHNKDLNIIYVDNADMNDAKLEKICKIIYNRHVKLVRGYLTSIDAITEYAIVHNMKLHHEGEDLIILSNGELLSETVRRRVIDKLGCHIVSQYGSEELGVLGMSELDAPGDKITLDLANHYFELLKLDSDEPVEKGEIGRIVVTDLSNYAMPLIRYDIGDLAVKGNTVDGELVSLEHLVGRRTDMICRTDGTFLDFFNSCPASVHNNENISQWQFIQKTQKTYDLVLKPANDIVYSQEKNIIDDLRKLLGTDADISIIYEKNIPVQVSGKRKTVINEYKKR